MAATTTRQTADQRRDTVLDAAMIEFGLKGLHGASTDDIARRAGISQPYLFRLFRTKRELFLASVERLLPANRADVPRRRRPATRRSSGCRPWAWPTASCWPTGPS